MPQDKKKKSQIEQAKNRGRGRGKGSVADRRRGKRGGKSKSKSVTKSKKTTKKNLLLEPGEVLRGKDLQRTAQSIVDRQTGSETRAYGRQADLLGQVLGRQTGDVQRLGAFATGRVDDYYKKLAEAERGNVATQTELSNRLQWDTGVSTANTQARLSEIEGEAQQRMADDPLSQFQTVPSKAREELQQIIAEQKGYATREGEALNRTAASQGKGWESIASNMATANQARGGETIGALQREVGQRQADLQNQYGPEIAEALANQADSKKSAADLLRETLYTLRGQEREHLLSKAALGLDKKELKTSSKQAKKEDKSGLKYLEKQAKLSNKNDRKSAKREIGRLKKQAQLGSKRDTQTHQQSLERIRANQAGYGGGGGGGKGKGGGKPQKREIKQAMDKARLYNVANADTKEKYDRLIAFLTQGGKTGSEVSRGAAIRAANRLTPYGRKKKKVQPYKKPSQGFDSSGFH
jgi:hypothetical protein